MVDEIEPVVDASVTDEHGHTHSFKTLASACTEGLLWIELTNLNMELLRTKPQASEEPVADAEAWAPTITQPNVMWNSQTHSVYCKYRDEGTGKYRTKSFKVLKSDDPGALDTKIQAVAELCQNFYSLHHVPAPEL